MVMKGDPYPHQLRTFGETILYLDETSFVLIQLKKPILEKWSYTQDAIMESKALACDPVYLYTKNMIILAVGKIWSRISKETAAWTAFMNSYVYIYIHIYLISYHIHPLWSPHFPNAHLQDVTGETWTWDRRHLSCRNPCRKPCNLAATTQLSRAQRAVFFGVQGSTGRTATCQSCYRRRERCDSW